MWYRDGMGWARMGCAQGWSGLGCARLAPTHHNAQAAVGRTLRPARDGGVEERDPGRGGGCVQLSCELDAHRARIDEQRAGRCDLEQPARFEEDRPLGRLTRDRDHDSRGPAAQLLEAAHSLDERARGGACSQGSCVAVELSDWVAGACERGRHAAAHVTSTDEAHGSSLRVQAA